MVEIRKLKASEIEARVSTLNENGASLLLYKDARVDQKILDEVFGVYGWQRTHQLIGDRLYCTIEIWDDDKKQWVAKQDVGTESNTEKEKGQASDSFKRAGFNVGIGRELYTAPFIWVPADKIAINKKTDYTGKERYYTNDKFEVTEIGYDDNGEINKLKIINEKTKAVVYEMGAKSAPAAAPVKNKPNQDKYPVQPNKVDFTELWDKYKGMTTDELRKEYVLVRTNREYTDKQKDAMCDIIKKCQEKRNEITKSENRGNRELSVEY
jgi:hypothetical protein